MGNFGEILEGVFWGFLGFWGEFWDPPKFDDFGVSKSLRKRGFFFLGEILGGIFALPAWNFAGFFFEDFREILWGIFLGGFRGFFGEFWDPPNP